MSHPELFPNPFQPHNDGPWEQRTRPMALTAIKDALRRHRAGEITREALREDKNKNGIKYWLWYVHHPDNNRWKNIGRPYWSHDAYTTWRRYYFATPLEQRTRNGAPAMRTLPKRSWAQDGDGLLHEHVVPQKVCLDLLIDHGVEPEIVLAGNLGAVITIREDRRLQKNHPDPSDPWLRYAGTGIKFISNPSWTAQERAALARHDLIFLGQIEPFADLC